ncbi:Na-translocating system protein MpsC family protein [Anaeromicrobium sediminis]|uniref:Stage 0 sporulation protein A homolog n=1 Tax=Anaeromicrobium sediminis TaxID=1478221 RepID=A0A267MGG7_9FIRM|nr:Na-translocating system protein MpsC family protein [Anaeromicrobium sediminis]PAB57965.1 hypothetical protein CCE28_17540 [Anaeromicrobium sediminis]
MNKEENLLYNLKVLYVEDEDIIREELSRFIKRRVGKLQVAKDGEEGIKKFNEYKPDMVITDLKMPKLDGIGMASKIRKVDNICPIIVITALSDVQSIISTIDVGIDKYIIKPIDTKALVEAMEAMAIKLYKLKSKENIINGSVLTKEEKKEVEKKIENTMAKFIKGSTGKGPKNVKTFIQGDMMTIQFFETRTLYEKNLLNNDDNTRIIDYAREVFFKENRTVIENTIKDILNLQVEVQEITINSKLDIDEIKIRLYI